MWGKNVELSFCEALHARPILARRCAKTRRRRLKSLDAVIVGGGQAGVSLSYFLKQSRISHIVLEKGRAFSVWYKRWDSFHMNTENWMNALPGADQDFAPGAPRGALGTKADAIAYFENYLRVVNPPLLEDTEVTCVQEVKDGTWRVSTSQTTYQTENVAICVGQVSYPKVPAVAADLPSTVPQLHSSEYRNPGQLVEGNALMVGSGASGVQICDDLGRSKRFKRLSLAVSGNAVVPWKVLGISLNRAAHLVGLLNITRTSWLGKRIYESAKGKGDVATPPSPAQLHETYDVELVGKVMAADRDRIECLDGQTVPLQDLTVVWCTGFRPRYDFIEVRDRERVFDEYGPIHERGLVGTAPGLYFVGLAFQYTPVSDNIYGAGRDAKYVAQHITDRVKAT